MLYHYAESHYVECHLCSVSLMLIVTYKPFRLSIVMLKVFVLTGMAPMVQVVEQSTNDPKFKCLNPATAYTSQKCRKGGANRKTQRVD
jgi:hypothetical protein